MEETIELLKTCTKGSKMNCFLYVSTKNRFYWSRHRRPVTSTLFTRWLTSQGNTKTISQKPVLVPSSVPTKLSCRKYHNRGKPAILIQNCLILVLYILLKYCYWLQDLTLRYNVFINNAYTTHQTSGFITCNVWRNTESDAWTNTYILKIYTVLYAVLIVTYCILTVIDYNIYFNYVWKF